jgi:hypothetical protein
VILGFNHIYQGVKAAIVTGITGLLFTAVLLVTGSLKYLFVNVSLSKVPRHRDKHERQQRRHASARIPFGRLPNKTLVSKGVRLFIGRSARDREPLPFDLA